MNLAERGRWPPTQTVLPCVSCSAKNDVRATTGAAGLATASFPSSAARAPPQTISRPAHLRSRSACIRSEATPISI
eukprot:6138896-Prymnesium_polylepis.2